MFKWYIWLQWYLFVDNLQRDFCGCRNEIRFQKVILNDKLYLSPEIDHTYVVCVASQVRNLSREHVEKQETNRLLFLVNILLQFCSNEDIQMKLSPERGHQWITEYHTAEQPKCLINWIANRLRLSKKLEHKDINYDNEIQYLATK